jgi:hypothetical protein
MRMVLDEIETPAPVVDLARMERNLDRMAGYASAHRLVLRPHIKTHKTPWLAAEQIRRGAVGVTCATPREAEVMSEITDDILVAYPMVGSAKARRVASLPDHVRLTVALDSARAADDLAVAISEAITKAPDDRARVATTIDAYLAFIEREPFIVRFLVDRGLEAHTESGVATSLFVARLGQMVSQAIGEAMRERGLDASPAEPWAYAIVGAVHMAGDWWLERKTLPRERLVDYLTVLVWDGMNAFQAQGREVTAGTG